MTAPTTVGWLRTAARRICQGSGILTRQLTRRTVGTTRKRAGEWRGGISRWLGESSGTVDSVARWAMLLIAAWLAWHLGSIPLHLAGRVLGAARWLLWVATVAWIVAAYRAAGERPAEVEVAEPDGEPAPAVDPVELLRRLIGEHRGVHIAVLRDALVREVPGRSWTTADVHQLLADAGIPTRHSIRRGLGVAVGVHRDDVPDRPSPTVGGDPGSGVEQQVSAATATATPVVEVLGGGAALIIKSEADRHQSVHQRAS